MAVQSGKSIGMILVGFSIESITEKKEYMILAFLYQALSVNYTLWIKLIIVAGLAWEYYTEEPPLLNSTEEGRGRDWRFDETEA